jgi:nondiscriminating glutamyl-tRNA synthetase
MMSPPVRVRIAPSPSGYFHVGTARTAIYNYLFARQHGGTFVLRIEDTDLSRSDRTFVDDILTGLKWLGLEWDEGPVFQSERQDLYGPVIEQLLSSGSAYRCYCTKEELQAERDLAMKNKTDWRYSRKCRTRTETQRQTLESQGASSVVRLAVPESGTLEYEDLVAGTLSRAHQEIDDFVLALPNGRALYNTTVVIDDHLMNISHVIRGNDHINNTFKQLLTYQALGWTPPQFAHIPLILRHDKGKISKRKGDPSLNEYSSMGLLPDAMFNFLSLLGWSAGDDREIFSPDELVQAFSLDRVNKSNPVFDPTKLAWMNGEYIRAMPAQKLVALVSPLLVAANRATLEEIAANLEWHTDWVELLRERCKSLNDFVAMSDYFFEDPTSFDPKGVSKHFEKEGAAERLTQLAQAWTQTNPFDPDSLEASTRALAEAQGIKPAPYIHLARLSISGATGGPGLYQLAAFVGRERCVHRMNTAATAIREGQILARPKTTQENKG